MNKKEEKKALDYIKLKEIEILEKALNKACQVMEDNLIDLVIEKDGAFKLAVNDEDICRDGKFKENFRRWLLSEQVS